MSRATISAIVLAVGVGLAGAGAFIMVNEAWEDPPPPTPGSVHSCESRNVGDDGRPYWIVVCDEVSQPRP